MMGGCQLKGVLPGAAQQLNLNAFNALKHAKQGDVNMLKFLRLLADDFVFGLKFAVALVVIALMI